MPNATYKVAGFCHGGRDQAAALIFNAETAVKRVFTVNNFLFREACPVSATPAMWDVAMTTAQTGGSSVAIIPMDSSSTVPSQVIVSLNTQVTVGGVLHGRWLVPTNTINVGAITQGGAGSGMGWNRQDTGSVFDYRGFSDTQATSLREGEGLAFFNLPSTDTPYPVAWQLTATLRMGTATYAVNTILTPHASLAGLGMFNGVGSGVVVEILSITLTALGATTATTSTTTDGTIVRLSRVYGYDGGVAVNPISYDGSPVPSQLMVMEHQEWSPLSIATNLMDPRNGFGMTDLGVPGTTVLSLAVQRAIGTFRQCNPFVYNQLSVGGASTGAFASSFQATGCNGFRPSGGVADVGRIRLNPGEGLAFIVNNYTPYAAFWYEAEITHEPPQVSGVSPGGYSS